MVNRIKHTKLYFLNFFIAFFLNLVIVSAQTPNVPYFYQYNNSINPGGSCQNTSIAMLLKYYGATAITPDAVSNTWGTSQAQTVSGFNTVCNSEAQNYGLSVTCTSTSSGSFAALNGLLAQGIPVAVHGYFTSYGHVMVVLAFTGTEYICNDPAGEWSQQYQNGGYSTTNATEGIQIHYGATAFLNAIGPDNTLWYHYINGSVPNLDNVAPTTQITAPTGWTTQDFTTTFTDTDNSGGSGIEKSFYQVLEYNGTEWRANNTRGFFSDNFDTAIHPDWTSASGTWAINGGYLEQSDEANTNTNIYAPLTQNLSNRYLYTWSGKIDGTGVSKRAGFHFFCDDASQTNRGNSYFVWFRADQSQLQIYKVVNNAFGSAAYSVPVTITPGTWYNYAVAYDRISGKMDVYVNNALIGSWTDSAPYSTGNFISFRSGDCSYMLNDLKVYRSRAASATILVGAASTNDIRYQNPSPAMYSGKIKSIVNDAAGNLSAIAYQNVYVDWTPPSCTDVNDGLAIDTDTTGTFSTLSANWGIAADTSSGVSHYMYAIGTSAGATDFVDWTDNSNNTSVTASGLSLTAGQMYYVSVKVIDSAGLSSICTSDGIIADEPIQAGIKENINSIYISAQPNPFNENVIINISLLKDQKLTLTLMDIVGKTIVQTTALCTKGMNGIPLNASDYKLSDGLYMLNIQGTEVSATVRLIKD